MTETQIQSKPDPKDYVIWLRFEESLGVMRRAIAPNGERALLLIIRDKERLQEMAVKAEACGFSHINGKGLFRVMIDENGRTPMTARQMAEVLGATPFPLLKTEMTGPKYTVHLSPRAPAPKDEKIEGPDPASIQRIGLNLNGEQVVRDSAGRFFRRVNTSTGEAAFISEKEDDRHTMFLRARSITDLDSIAGSLLVMAGRSTLHGEDFDRVIDAAIEPVPGSGFDISRGDAARRIALSMVRQIADEAVRDDASTKSFQSALRLGASTSFVIGRTLEGDKGFNASPMMAAFLRRHVRGSQAVDFRGSPSMAASLPRLHEATAERQVQDLSSLAPDSMRDYIVNVLHRRPDQGQSLMIIPGKADAEHVDRIRHDIGRQFSLECVAEITSSVATGRQDEEPVTLMSFGARRPEPLDALPQAAMRTFPVMTADDLRNFEREVLRARNRIKDFHEGIEVAAEGRDNDRENNVRQRPYQALSRSSEPFTMLPVALEGATTIALDRVRRDFDEKGGVDAVVAYGLGRSIEVISDHLTAEQVDAVAMRTHAASRGRGFLLADQTGIGKGRSLAAMAASEMRHSGKKVLYFTESGQINVRDVVRDLVGVGVKPVDAQSNSAQEGETRIAFLSRGSHFTFERQDQATGEMMESEITSMKSKACKAMMESGVWIEEADMIITTYTQFNFREDDPKSAFLDAVDENTLLVFDESHNALNPRSNAGRNLRALISRVGSENVIFGTATFARSSLGLDLYAPLLPAAMPADFFEGLSDGGEVALESFSTMLAQDGVLLRRDHDLSSIEFHVSLPDDARMQAYQEIMDGFSPVVEAMIDTSSAIGEYMGRAQSLETRRLINAGLSPQAARAATNEMNQYSIGVGAPLSNLARIAMNAIKVDQLVDQALEEIREGRKPLITFHSTNAALLMEVSKDDEGKLSPERMAAAAGLTLRDQIHRIHESIYRIRLDGNMVDARDQYPDVAEMHGRVQEMIRAIPADLPVSPIDAVIERLEAHGIAVGEISGRNLCYRDGQVKRREGRDRKATIDAFNDGTLDVMIYNAAGSTGGSFHASADFKDQRPRTMLEFEPPLDPIKYVQGLGRGNRFGQVAKPRVTSVVTGLTPEMRIMQQRNNKLRMLGASIDGNRSHPMLIDDVPDLLNKVGDAATRSVLMAMPAMARRLGFPEFAEASRDDETAVGNDDADTGSGGKLAIDSLANKVLSRSLSLSAKDQGDLVQRIQVEFDALIEELDSRNANPLRPKQLEGVIKIRDTGLFSGDSDTDTELDKSAFTAPLYMSTGVHSYSEKAWSGEKLLDEVEKSQRLYGVDGFSRWAERLEQNLPAIMRAYLPTGVSIEAALEDPAAVGGRLAHRHSRITDLKWLLENMKPGVAMRYPSFDDLEGENQWVIVSMSPPREAFLFDTPAAYRVSVISAGETRPVLVSLGRIMQNSMDRIHFSPGLSEGVHERFMADFDRQAEVTRKLPVQILSGNILAAIQESRRHDLGTVSLYTDDEGHMHRGIVVARGKVDLQKLPVPIPSGDVAAEIARRLIEGTSTQKNTIKIYGTLDVEGKAERSSESDFIITLLPDRAVLDFVAFKKSHYQFYADHPGLHELLKDGAPLPPRSEVKARVGRSAGHKPLRLDLTDPTQAERLYDILECLDDAPMVANGEARKEINEVMTMITRVRDGYAPVAHAGDHQNGQPEGTRQAAAAPVEIDRPAADEPEEENEPAWVADLSDDIRPEMEL